MKEKNKKFGARLVLYFMGVVFLTLLLTVLMIRGKAEDVLNDNASVNSEAILNQAMEDFDTYLKVLSLPVDLNCRKNEFKKIDENYNEDSIKTIEDAMLSALKVIPNSYRAFYSTASGIYIQAKLVIDPETGKKTGDYVVNEGVNHMSDVWFADAQGLKGRSNLTVFSNVTKPYINDEGVEVITISQDLKAGDVHVGVVAMDIETVAFKEYVNNIKIMTSGFGMLVSEEGDILFCNEENASLFSASMKDTLDWSALVAKAQAASEAEYDEETDTYGVARASTVSKVGGTDYQIMIVKDDITNWYLVGCISSKENKSYISTILQRCNLAVVVSLIVGIISAILISKSISTALKRVNAASARLAEGDLTENLAAKRHDEFGLVEEHFNIMTKNLSELIGQVSDDAEVILNVSKDVNVGSNEIKEVTKQVTQAISVVAKGATEQAQATHDATAKVDELARSLEATSEKVDIIGEHSMETKNLSRKGNEILEDLSKKSERAKDNARISIDTMAEMLSALDKINFISDAIVEITSQTNLLSLNASIEAARAGEAGKGFAVVADEIRKLADQSAESTEEIKNILAEIKKSSDLVEASLRESGEIQNEQQKTIIETQEVFGNIADSISELESRIAEIQTLNAGMNKIRTDVVNTMASINTVSENSAASAEEVYASTEQVNEAIENVTANAEELDKIVKTLDESIHKFKF